MEPDDLVARRAMLTQRIQTLSATFLPFIVGIGVGIAGTMFYSYQFEHPKAPSCSDDWGIEHINATMLERANNHWSAGNVITDIQISRPLTSKHVRTMTLSPFGNTCTGELELSYVHKQRKLQSELPTLYVVDGKWVDKDGKEYTELYKDVPKQFTVKVNYERYVTDDRTPWIVITNNSNPADMVY